MSHSRHVQRRHTWMRTLKLEELEQRLLLNGDPGISTVQASYSLADLDGSDGFVLEGILSYPGFDQWVSKAGDVNEYGYDDMLIGSYKTNDERGRTYLVFGKSTSFDESVDLIALDGTDGFSMQGIDKHELSGRSVSSAGDINGDGYADVIVGSPNNDDGSTDAGKVYVFEGTEDGI